MLALRRLLLSKARNGNPRKKISGFYKPFSGASNIRSFTERKYERLGKSLFHFPPVNAESKQPESFLRPAKSLRASLAREFGPNTLYLQGLPRRRTPEFLQERLRRYFSKFGEIQTVRILPDERDAYQSGGTGAVVFSDQNACREALKRPLVFPASLQSREIRMTWISEDKRNGGDWSLKTRHGNSQLVHVARQLYERLRRGETLTISDLPLVLRETQLRSDRQILGDASLGEIFEGDWRKFLTFNVNAEIFHVDASTGLVRSRLVPDADRKFLQLKIALQRKSAEEISVHWRLGRPALPYFTQRQIRKWLHKDKLPDALQLLSRPFKRMRVFDERLMVKLRLNAAKRKCVRFRRRLKTAELQRRSLAVAEAKTTALNNRAAASGALPPLQPQQLAPSLASTRAPQPASHNLPANRQSLRA